MTQSGVMKTASDPLFFLLASFLLSMHALFIVIPCFTFTQFHTFMPESCPALPQTSTVGHSAASPEHYSFTFPSSPPHQRPFIHGGFLYFQNHLVHIQNLGGGHTSSGGAGFIGPIVHCGFTRSQCITAAVPLIGKVSSIRGHD